MRRIAGAVVAILAGSTASADVVQDRAAALFDEGQRLIEAGAIADACAKFEASLAVDPAVGTKLNLADCFERLNKLATAYTLFEQAEAEASRAGLDSVNRARVTLARERMQRLVHKLVRVRVRVGEPELAGLLVVLDAGGKRRDLPRETWSKTQLVEPGAIVVEATAPERQQLRIVRGAAADSEITIDVPGLAPEQHVVAPTKRRLAAYISGGAGGALLLSSIVLGLHAKAKYDHALEQLGPNVDQQIDSAQFQANFATALAVVGVAGLAAGIVLYVGARDRFVVVPGASDGTVGLAAIGRF